MTQAPGDSARTFVVEQRGVIRVINGASNTVFMDIDTRVEGPASAGDETGLLGLAFHPNYAANGRFFVHYYAIRASDGNAVTRISEFGRATADTGNTASERILLDVVDNEGNHNGGSLHFGPDGFLYMALGDGGGGCDQHGATGNAQNRNSYFGKILRVDVDASMSPYAIPATNPFAGMAGVKQEIWAYGLRNPWRTSFDRTTGDYWMGDVGQDLFEEIDVCPAGQGGKNFGWRIIEANQCVNQSSCAAIGSCTQPASYVAPVATVSHNPDGACAIIGGYVYRGSAIPALAGTYLYTDACAFSLRSLRWQNGQTCQNPQFTTGLPWSNGISSFGQDNAGELYVVDLNGPIYKIIP